MQTALGLSPTEAGLVTAHGPLGAVLGSAGIGVLLQTRIATATGQQPTQPPSTCPPSTVRTS
ncbi:hypothetical protein [Streptomyces shenzhenensis]|uniref:Uncharacterized protein n=1 Tax=Streptomyces shenzhenensis TaxID=943815 RepID=A0A3M0ID56_9ACTN|nr:hypothetical protein [Streptomyces shenzhenensis]RMB86987.1 hypothetical protein CTZ28_03330 [Streptomyces shenzhenensis]